jgi:hypothetical protein
VPTVKLRNPENSNGIFSIRVTEFEENHWDYGVEEPMSIWGESYKGMR